jgi:rubrerythrin
MEYLINGGSGDPETGLPAKDLVQALESAIHGETHEYTSMYPGMARDARDEGFDEVADWFDTLAKAERSHAGKFKKTLDAYRAENV